MVLSALSIVQKLLAQDAEQNSTAAGAKIAELERAKAAAVAAEDYRRAAELKEEIALAVTTLIFVARTWLPPQSG